MSTRAGAGPAAGARPATVDGLARLFDEAAVIIRAEYSEHLRLADLAWRLCVSRRQLQRAFREAGTTYREQLTRTRVRAAARMLAEGELPVREVARAVGYAPAQFAKPFRSQVGVTPTRFRRQHR